MQPDPSTLIFDASLAGICTIVLLQLLLSGIRYPWQVALMLVFVGALWVQVSSIMIELAIPHYLTVTGRAAVFLAIGSLWVYTAMITDPAQSQFSPGSNSHDQPADPRGWRYYWSYYRHLWPLPVALILLLKTASLPDADFVELLKTGDADTDTKMAAVMPYLIVQLLLTVWVLPYLVSILRKLSRYRKTLKDIYSSTENLEMLWITALVGVIFLDWCRGVLESIDIFGPEIVMPSFIEWPLDGLVILIPALWGLRQISGMRQVVPNELAPIEVRAAEEQQSELQNSVKTHFRNHKLEEPRLKELSLKARPEEVVGDQKEVNHAARLNLDTEVAGKYERSALEEADVERIANKIEQAMQTDNLYREPGLSLAMLSKHIGVSSNYISQTLNVHMQESFFTYINRLRVIDAEKTLRSTDAQSGDTILQIAYDSGFNSRSSFYKAFKKQFACAPAAYRKKLLQQAAEDGVANGTS